MIQILNFGGYPFSPYSKNAAHIILLLLFIALGPYLSHNIGVRIEHCFIYPMYILVMSRLLSNTYLKINLTVLYLLLLLSGVSVWIFFVTLLQNTNNPILQLLAAAENFMQPIAIILIVSIYANRISLQDRPYVLRQACTVICILLSINSFVALASVFIDTWPFVKFFVRHNAWTEVSRIVWKNAATSGRYPGIFNQPFEAGLAYSIGLIAWVYAFSMNKLQPYVKAFLISRLFLGGIFLGGILSISKVFLLGGIPLFLFYYYWNSKKNISVNSPIKIFPRVIGGFLLLSGGVAMFLRVFDDIWIGKDFLLRLFDPHNLREQGFLDLYTAGRLGRSESHVKILFSIVRENAFLYGFGFGNPSALDNSFLQFFYQGGFVAVLFYIFILSVLLWHGISHYSQAKNECKLLLTLFILIIGAGLGAPVLTINRSSIFLWVLVILSICSSYNEHHITVQNKLK